jgi:cAMP-dependent protein kinase regulator
MVSALSRHEVREGKTIVTQGADGDALYIVAEGQVAVIRHGKGGGSDLLAKLGPGAFFGEMAIVSKARRAAEVKALEDTLVLRVQKRHIEKLVRRAPAIGDVLVAFCHARMLENLMRVSPVLSPVPLQKRPDLLAAFSTDYHEAGAVIIREGHPGEGLYLLVSGEVVVSRLVNGEKTELARLGPGDVFGEISLLMQKTSTATVTASMASAFLFLPTADFMAATGEFPELLKGAFDIALEREARNASILARPTHDGGDSILI